MHSPEEINIAWQLFNLLEELSNLLFDRYDHQFLDRFLQEEQPPPQTEHDENIEDLNFDL